MASGGPWTPRRVRALRDPKEPVDPWRPLGVLKEEERGPAGPEPVLTVFLAGAECPFSCIFCDLYRHTLDGPTPPGAIPRQIALALARGRRFTRVKLYNASNFFDPRAVPPEDDGAIADQLAGVPEVTVECHPRFVGRRAYAFAERLDGRLEVALGLETVHPEVFPRLVKGARLADFERAAGDLLARGVGWRAFALVGAPWVPAVEAAPWAVRTVAWALERGAGRVSLIPLRISGGALAVLAAAGEVRPVTLRDLEDALDHSLLLAAHHRAVVAADLWDAERFAPCGTCRGNRLARLRRMNDSGAVEPRIRCAVCEASGP
jgi:hypothetical protein